MYVTEPHSHKKLYQDFLQCESKYFQYSSKIASGILKKKPLMQLTFLQIW